MRHQPANDAALLINWLLLRNAYYDFFYFVLATGYGKRISPVHEE